MREQQHRAPPVLVPAVLPPVASRLVGQALNHDAAGAPTRALPGLDAIDRDLESGLQLLALPEIGLHAIGQRRPVQLDDALVGLPRLVLVDRKRQMAATEQGLDVAARRRGDLRVVVAGIAAHGAIVGAVREHQRHRAVAADLQAEGAVELQATGERRGENEELAQQASDRLGVVVPGQYLVDQIAEPDHPAAQRRALQLERAQQIVRDQASAHPLAPATPSAQTPREDALLRVQPVLRLVEHDRTGTVDHLGGNLLAAMRRQTMHEQRLRLRRFHQGDIDLVGRQ